MEWLHITELGVQLFFFLLSKISVDQLVVLIAITASFVAMLLDWRLGLLAQTLQSLFVGLLLAHWVLPQMAMLLPLVGALAALVLYWTGRQIAPELERHGFLGNWLDSSNEMGGPMGFPFRLLVLLFWALAITTVSIRFPLPEVPGIVAVAAYWLLGMGLLAIILTRDPFKTGLGLLTFSNGFELVYMLFDPGLLVFGLLGIGNILTALVASYLTVARHADLLTSSEALPPPDSQEALLRAVRTLYPFPQRLGEGDRNEEEPEEALVP